jgi:hypothetical protein
MAYVIEQRVDHFIVPDEPGDHVPGGVDAPVRNSDASIP